MGGKTPAVSFISGFILVLVNTLSMMMASLLVAIGAWMIASPSTLYGAIQRIQWPAFTAVLQREVMSVELGTGLILLGCFVLFVTILGGFGTLARSQLMLLMYSMLVVLLLLLECALFYYITSQLIEKWNGGWTDGDIWNAAGHGLRLAFRCCGRDNYTNIIEEGRALPWSCCGVAPNCITDRVYSRGCSIAISSWLSTNQLVVYTSLALVHVTLASCSLLRRTCIVSSLPHGP